MANTSVPVKPSFLDPINRKTGWEKLTAFCDDLDNLKKQIAQLRLYWSYFIAEGLVDPNWRGSFHNQLTLLAQNAPKYPQSELPPFVFLPVAVRMAHSYQFLQDLVNLDPDDDNLPHGTMLLTKSLEPEKNRISINELPHTLAFARQFAAPASQGSPSTASRNVQSTMQAQTRYTFLTAPSADGNYSRLHLSHFLTNPGDLEQEVQILIVHVAYLHHYSVIDSLNNLPVSERIRATLRQPQRCPDALYQRLQRIYFQVKFYETLKQYALEYMMNTGRIDDLCAKILDRFDLSSPPVFVTLPPLPELDPVTDLSLLMLENSVKPNAPEAPVNQTAKNSAGIYRSSPDYAPAPPPASVAGTSSRPNNNPFRLENNSTASGRVSPIVTTNYDLVSPSAAAMPSGPSPSAPGGIPHTSSIRVTSTISTAPGSPPTGVITSVPPAILPTFGSPSTPVSSSSHSRSPVHASASPSTFSGHTRSEASSSSPFSAPPPKLDSASRYIMEMAASSSPAPAAVGNPPVASSSSSPITASAAESSKPAVPKKNEKRSIFVLGESGAGKSALCRYLAECSALEEADIALAKKLFVSSAQADGMTTSVAEVKINSINGECRIYDTPGLNDPNQRDDLFVADVVKTMRQVDDCGAIILVVPHSESRAKASTQRVLELFHGILGNSIISMLMVVFTQAHPKLRKKAAPNKMEDYRTLLLGQVFGASLVNNSSGVVPTFAIDCLPDDEEEGELKRNSMVAQSIVSMAFAHSPLNCGQLKLVFEPAPDPKQAMKQLAQELAEAKEKLQVDLKVEKEKADKTQHELQEMRQRYQESLVRDVQIHIANHVNAGGSPSASRVNGLVWVPPFGHCYHSTNGCAGGRAERVTQPEARRQGYNACSKCI